MADEKISFDAEVHRLREQLARETDRADRAEVEVDIVWSLLATIRDLAVKSGFQVIAMGRGYESVKAMESRSNLEVEIDRRLAERRSRQSGSE